jgi:hypothetical protein
MRNPSCPNSPSILNSPNQTLSDSLDKRLLGYMAAAGAAGVGMLAMTQSADAKVVYTAANRSITSGSRLDLNNDNIPDYAFHGPFAICGTCSYFNVIALKFNKFMSSAHPLAAGISVGPGGKFSGREDQMTNFCTCSGHSAAGGPWLGIQNEYMGFEFNIKGAAHFGWARFSVTDQGAITLTGYAYETVSLKPIVTGDTENDDQESMDQQEPAAATTQSSSLGRLALGAR